MSTIMSIAASGMAAAERRLEVSARNVANALSTGPLKASGDVSAAFSALRLDQMETADGGTATRVSISKPGTIAISDPGSPFADQNGMVAAPDVDYANEAIQQMIASYSFAANAKIMRAAADMQKSLLDMRV